MCKCVWACLRLALRTNGYPNQLSWWWDERMWRLLPGNCFQSATVLVYLKVKNFQCSANAHLPYHKSRLWDTCRSRTPRERSPEKEHQCFELKPSYQIMSYIVYIVSFSESRLHYSPLSFSYRSQRCIQTQTHFATVISPASNLTDILPISC